VAPAKTGKAAPLQKFLAIYCKFIQYHRPDKTITGHRLTLSQASALGKCWFPPMRDEAGCAWWRQV
jgi:hypothetical protein